MLGESLLLTFGLILAGVPVFALLGASRNGSDLLNDRLNDFLNDPLNDRLNDRLNEIYDEYIEGCGNDHNDDEYDSLTLIHNDFGSGHYDEEAPAPMEPICPATGNCSKTDQRGILWEGQFGDLIRQNCSEGSGTAKWYCDGCLHTFEGSQPDRTECVETWVLDIGNMISDAAESSVKISAKILENTKPTSEDDPGMTGGSIITLVNLYGELLTKHEYEDGSTEDRTKFTNNIVTCTSVLIEQKQGWSEIKPESLRFNTYSRILMSMDSIGYIFGKNKTKSDCNQDEHVFPSENVNLIVRAISSSDTEKNTCFTFDDIISSGSICLPPADMRNEDKNCSIHVASSFSIESKTSILFPDILRSTNKSILGNSLIGLTIDDGRNEIELQEEAAPIVVTFNHDENMELYGPRTCIFWNFDDLTWSSEGCQFSPIGSDAHTTVCRCRHLTNFGVLFDYVGNADPTDSLLSILSMVLLILSCLAILVTQALLFFLKSDKRSSTRKLVENNRNLTLFGAQISFIVLAGQHVQVSDNVCQSFGALIHLLYLSFFAWTAIEGYSFYRALVTVFDTKHHSRLLFLCIGYGLPLLVMGITVVVSQAGGGKLFLRRDIGGDVVACWLDVEAMPAMVIPAGLVLFGNLFVTAIAIYIAHQAGNRRNISSKSKILGTMRNTILLSVLLGLTWITALIPTSTFQQYMSVILNASTGLYILAYSVVANKQVRGELRERMVGRVSQMVNTMSTASTADSTHGSESSNKASNNVATNSSIS